MEVQKNQDGTITIVRKQNVSEKEVLEAINQGIGIIAALKQRREEINAKILETQNELNKLAENVAIDEETRSKLDLALA